MKLKDLVKLLKLDIRAGKKLLELEVTGGYAGDMLSDVLANSRKGNIWITLQTHMNIVAVAGTKELSGIIIVNGRIPEDAVLKKADDEKIPIMITNLSAYNMICRLYELGVR